MTGPDFEAWRCSRHDDRFCPPEGCAADYGCAIDHGWSQGQPTPLGCDGIRQPIDLLDRPWPATKWGLFKFGAGFAGALIVLLAIAFYTGFKTIAVILVNEMHPAAWALVILVVSFTLAMFLPFWFYCVYGACATAFALWLYLGR